MFRRVSDNPAATTLLSFFIGTCIFGYCSYVVKLAVACVAFIFMLMLLCVPAIKKLCREHGGEKLRKTFVAVGSAVVLASVLSVVSFDIVYKNADRAAGKSETASFYIVSLEKEYPYAAYYKANVERSELLREGTTVLLTVDGGGLYNGDIIEAEVEYHSLGEKSTDSFDGKGYYLPRGMKLIAEAEYCDVLDNSPRLDFSTFFANIRSKTGSLIRAQCGKDTGSLVAAILLGDKSSMPASVKRDFRRCGASHLLVISGMHFSIFLAVFELLLRRLRIKPRGRAWVNIGFIIVFMCVTGLSASVTRAGIMHLAAQISRLLTRKENTIISYSLAGSLIVLVSPFSVLDIGFQLSFAATLACIVYVTSRFNYVSDKTKEQSKNKSIIHKTARVLVDSVSITFTVTMFTLPLSWMYFGEISLISIPMNIIGVPLISVLMYVGAAFLVLYKTRIFVTSLAWIIKKYGGFVLSVFHFAAKQKGVVLPISYDFTPFFIIPLVVLLVLISAVRHNKRLYFSAAGLFAIFVCTAGVCGILNGKQNALIYVPSGKNDGIVVRSGGDVLVADMSSGSFGFSYDLTNAAKELNATEIDTVLLTHYHNKHVTYFGNLCEREIVSILVLPEPVNENEQLIHDSLCDTAEEYGVDAVTVANGEEYRFGDCMVSVYPRKYLSRTSHPVSALALRCDGERAILVSESWNEGDERIADEIRNAEYVFFGEHSPVYKKNFTLALSDSAKKVVLGDKAAEYAQGTDEYADIICERDKIEIYPERTDNRK